MAAACAAALAVLVVLIPGSQPTLAASTSPATTTLRSEPAPADTATTDTDTTGPEPTGPEPTDTTPTDTGAPETTADLGIIGANPDTDAGDVALIAVVGLVVVLGLAAWWMARRDHDDAGPPDGHETALP
jgi:hypothetical protein